MGELNFSYTVDEEIAEKELVKTIERFLRKLSEADRDIFVRRYWYPGVQAAVKEFTTKIGKIF